VAAAEAKAVAAEEAAAAPARALADALLSRGHQLTRPQVSGEGVEAQEFVFVLTMSRVCAQVSTLDSQSRPTLQADGSLVWPVAIMYPEGMTQDSIQVRGG
jgi:hypothetical protein